MSETEVTAENNDANAKSILATTGQRRGFAPAAEVEDTVIEPAPELDLPAGNDPIEVVAAEAEVVAEEVVAEPPAAEEIPKVKVRIGRREFDSEEEARSYAEELELKDMANEAFRQGIETAQRATVPPPQAAKEEEVPIDFYTNPAEFLKKRDAEVAQKIKSEIKAENEIVARHNKTMSDFYSDYPDLVGQEDYVQFLINKNWNQIQHLDTKVALRKVADEALAPLKKLEEKFVAKQELTKTKVAASSGTTGKVTQPKAEEKPLNFVSQAKNLKSAQGRAAARKRLGL